MREILSRLESNMRAELARQKTLAAAIGEKVEAIRERDAVRIEKAVEALAAIGIEGIGIESERKGILDEMGPEFGGTPPSSLSQVMTRIGIHNPALVALHRELREAAIAAESLCRKSSHLVRHFREVYTVALDRVFEAAGIKDLESPDGRVSSGIVVNAEG